MKPTQCLLRAAAALALAFAVAPSSFAAAPDPAADYPEERGVEAGDQWREKLGLNAEQARKFTAMEAEKDARLKPLRELLRLSMIQLQAQLAENAPEGDVQDLLNQVLQIRRVIAERSARYDAGRASFLSSSQRARLVVWQSLGGLNGYAARRLEAAARRDSHDAEHEKE